MESLIENVLVESVLVESGNHCWDTQDPRWSHSRYLCRLTLDNGENLSIGVEIIHKPNEIVTPEHAVKAMCFMMSSQHQDEPPEQECDIIDTIGIERIEEILYKLDHVEIPGYCSWEILHPGVDF